MAPNEESELLPCCRFSADASKASIHHGSITRQGSQAQEAYETRKQMAPDTKNRVRFASGWFGAKGTAPGTHLASASHSCFGEPEPRKMLRLLDANP